MAGAGTVQTNRVADSALQEPADRTQAIVTAAHELLDEGGLDELTIRAVLRRTGLARRAFYERFAGKDDLVIAVFARAMRMAAAMYGELIAPIPEPIDRLKILLRSLGRGASAPDKPVSGQEGRLAAALSREHIRLAEARPAELQAALEPLLALIADELARGMASGSVRQADPARLALFVYNLIATTVQTELIVEVGDTASEARRDQLADELWEFCRRAIIV
jgi:AcrR family transcriptional regulator